MLNLGDVRLIKGHSPKKTPPKLIFNNPRSSIKPESAPDPMFLC